MAEIDRIKRNISKMIDMGAPESDIDEYVASEGVTVEQLQAPAQPKPVTMADFAKPQTIQEGVPFMTADGPLVLRNGKVEVISQQEYDVATGKQKTAGQLGRQMVADDEIVDRGSILPLGQTKSGNVTWAMPEVLMAAPQGAATIMQGMKGAPITGQELAESTLTAVAPFAGSVGGVSATTRPGKLTKTQVRNAPTTKQLKKVGGAKIDKFARGGESVSGDDFADFWIKADDVLKRAGYDPENTPAVAARMKSLAARANKDTIQADELVNIRKGISDMLADKMTSLSDQRIGKILLDEFDDFAGTVKGAAGWEEGRKLYSQGMKSEIIDKAISKAKRTKSGFENGLRNQFRSILNSDKKSRGFSAAEKQLMENIVQGDFTTNTLSKLSMLSYGSEMQRNPFALISGATGMGIGSTFGGLPGGAFGFAVPGTIGYGAQKMLGRVAENNANALRATAAGAKAAPRTIFNDAALVPRMVTGSMAPRVEDARKAIMSGDRQWKDYILSPGVRK